MFNKRLLIVPALVVSTVVVGTIYLSSDKNPSQLTVSAGIASYSVTIDVNHPLLPAQDKTNYPFRLHNTGAYSALYVSKSGALSTTLPAGYEDYVFSFTTDDDSYFQMRTKNWESTDYVEDVKQTLWGIPNPTKVELVYNDAGENLTLNAVPYPSSKWGTQQTEQVKNGDKTDTRISYTDNDPSVASASWSTSIATAGLHTIYVRSMTVWYTCG